MVDSQTGEEQSWMRYYNPNKGTKVLLFLVQRCDNAYFKYHPFSTFQGIAPWDPFPPNIEKTVVRLVIPKDKSLILYHPAFRKEGERIQQAIKMSYEDQGHHIDLWIRDVLSCGPSQKGDFRLISDIPQVKEPCPTVVESDISQTQQAATTASRASVPPRPPIQTSFKKAFLYWVAAVFVGCVIGTVIRMVKNWSIPQSKHLFKKSLL